jgi:DNA-binding transcriptional ArsR family regulator
MIADPGAPPGQRYSPTRDTKIALAYLSVHTDRCMSTMTGDQLIVVLSALAHPQRLRIIAALTGGRNYVSQLARELNMGRPLLHLHLRRLEAAGLVTGTLELSPDGKAMRYFEVTRFTVSITPPVVREAVESLTIAEGEDK